MGGRLWWTVEDLTGLLRAVAVLARSDDSKLIVWMLAQALGIQKSEVTR